MSLLVLSASHHSAAPDLLSRLALDAAASTKLAHALVAGEYVDEAVVLSTCNRTEIHLQVDRFHAGLQLAVEELAAVTGVGTAELHRVCGVSYDEAAVRHLFRVASGLDSLVVGESQILGQVRSALTTSQSAGTVGTALNALFQQALRVGKRVQTETSIGTAGRSMVSAALDLAGDLDGRTVTVLGAGAIAGVAAHAAAAQGAEVIVVNRTLERAERLADQVGGRALGLSELSSALTLSEVLIAGAGARSTLVGPAALAGTPVRTVVDLAVPADVDPVVAATVDLIDVARLMRAEDGHQQATAASIGEAGALVDAEISDFIGSRRAAKVTPTVVALRSMAAEVVGRELDRFDGRVPDLGQRERAEVERTVRRIVDKLLHRPTVAVQSHLADGSADYASALRELFALDLDHVTAVSSAEAGVVGVEESRPGVAQPLDTIEHPDR